MPESELSAAAYPPTSARQSLLLSQLFSQEERFAQTAKMWNARRAAGFNDTMSSLPAIQTSNPKRPFGTTASSAFSRRVAMKLPR